MSMLLPKKKEEKTKTINEPIKINVTPSLQTIKDYFKNEGLVGEENNACIMVIALLRLQNLLIESESGAGKSMIADTGMKLFPQETVYKLEFTSKTGLMYDQEIFNKARIVYIPELQKAYSDMNIDILKSITEKKNVERKVTKMMDFSGGKPKFGGVKKQALRGDNKCILSTLALENKMKKDEELNRRILTIHTDITAEQNRKVINSVGKKRFKPERFNTIPIKEITDLKNHCNNVLNLKELFYENPFAEFISNKVPTGFIIVRSYIKHYLDLMEGVSKFHYQDRLIKDNTLFMNIQDAIMLHELYGQLFNQKIHHLPQLGKPIMDCFKAKDIGYKKNKDTKYAFVNEDDETRTYLSSMEIHKALKKQNMLIKHKVIGEQCEVLMEAGFLGKEVSGKKILYYQTDEVINFEEDFPWEQCLKEGRRLMKKHYPQYYDDWDSRNDMSMVKIIHKRFEEKKLLKQKVKVEDNKGVIIKIIKLFGTKPYVELSMVYGEAILDKMIEEGDLIENPAGTLRVLE